MKFVQINNYLLFVHILFTISCYDNNSSKERRKDVVMTFITHKFFHNNCPGKPLPGHSSLIGNLLFPVIRNSSSHRQMSLSPSPSNEV